MIECSHFLLILNLIFYYVFKYVFKAKAQKKYNFKTRQSPPMWVLLLENYMTNSTFHIHFIFL